MSNLSTFRRLCAVLPLALCTTALNAATVTLEQTRFGGTGKTVSHTTDLDASGLQRNLSGSQEGISEDTSPAEMKFDYFDASLGTLTDVEIIFTLTNLGTNRVTREVQTCRKFGVGSCDTRMSAEVSVSYGVLIDPYVTTLPGAPGYRNPTELGVGASETLNSNENGDSFSPSMRSALVNISGPGSQLPNFEGTGTFGIQPIFVVRNDTFVSCSSSFGTNITECSGETRVTYNANYRVDVKYTYDEFPPESAPVPLPAGLPMLLAGLGAFGLLRRRQGQT
ncbi:putative secreted protein [Litoreibacter ponti]|uniref:Putative secreted protein n=1 Tax=Litoreibacter ponti TaxID=1510457 RepID=A0A2T6BDD2_9RHOB|nr:VPLPA-CTERM sorting domain-containing protein [Litoreibacter ponti]PTX54049.1 putative secreted protein [Litoreibacter ponti]